MNLIPARWNRHRKMNIVCEDWLSTCRFLWSDNPTIASPCGAMTADLFPEIPVDGKKGCGKGGMSKNIQDFRIIGKILYGDRFDRLSLRNDHGRVGLPDGKDFTGFFDTDLRCNKPKRQIGQRS